MPMTQCDCHKSPSSRRCKSCGAVLLAVNAQYHSLPSVNAATLSPARVPRQDVPPAVPRPRGHTPQGYCTGSEVLRNTHAKKEVHPFKKGRDRSTKDCEEEHAEFVYCIPASGSPKPPHDGATHSVITDFKGAAIAWEAKILLSYKPHGSSLSHDGVQSFLNFFAENNGELYIFQELTRITRLFTRRRSRPRVERKVFVEEFLLDDVGRAVCLDPHWQANEWPRFCKLESEENADLELVWKRPKAGSTRRNRPFHFYGSSLEVIQPSSDEWTERYNRRDVDGGRAGFDVVPLGVHGNYFASPPYLIDHCPPDFPGGQTPVGTPQGASGEVPPDSREPAEPPPPESGGGTPTEPGDVGGGELTLDELRRRIEAAL